MNRFIFSFVISFIFLEAKSEPGRRLGKLENQTWTEHLSLARNQFNYSSSDQIPDFSSVGALVSNNGVVGTATLIAPNLVVSAAHVVKNSLNDPSPDPEDWSFVLSDNFETALISHCLLYTSPSPRDKRQSRMPSSA